MKLLLPKTENIPLSKLPYGFQKRLIALAPLRILNDVGRVCSDVRMFRSFCPTAFDKVLITDNDNDYQEALKNSFSNQAFKFMCRFSFFKILLEMDGEVLEEYHVVIHVNDILKEKLHIYVADTLLLNCSINSYKKVMKFITGPYTRLVLNGHITWKQVKWILHPGVKKVSIKAVIQIPGESYDNFADFVVKRIRDSEFSFAMYHNKNLETSLQDACGRHKFDFKRHQESAHIHIVTLLHDFVYFPKRCYAGCIVMYTSMLILFGLLQLICVVFIPQK